MLCVCVCVCVCLTRAAFQFLMFSDGGLAFISMETETPTAEDIQLLKKTVETEASQVDAPVDLCYAS